MSDNRDASGRVVVPLVVVVFDPPLFRLANFKRPDLRLVEEDDDGMVMEYVLGVGIFVVFVVRRSIMFMMFVDKLLFCLKSARRFCCCCNVCRFYAAFSAKRDNELASGIMQLLCG